MSLLTLDDAPAVARAAADLVLDACRARPAAGIMLAGGTTPRAAYEKIAARARPGDFEGVHVWFGDERMVPPDHADSNYGMAARAWLDGAASAHVHRIRGELGGPEAARIAEEELRAHGGASIPELDLVLLGIGTDGHTASLFPGDAALEAPPGALFVPARGGARVTATLALLSAARHVVFLATGAAKAEICARVLGEPPTAAHPASLVRAPRITWLLDREAAALLR
jgi:6-phosphogluconolactonase